MKAFDITSTVVTTVIAKDEREAINIFKENEYSPQAARSLSVSNESRKYEITNERDLSASASVVKHQIWDHLTKFIEESVPESEKEIYSKDETIFSAIAPEPMQRLEIILGLEDLYQLCIPKDVERGFTDMTLERIVDYVYEASGCN